MPASFAAASPLNKGEVGPAGVPRRPRRPEARREAAEERSGRLQLAEWLTDPANPLTARVMVNRIWQYHFGRGIVATPSDFGTRGTPPTHPELLDYLAVRFVKAGWSVKAMHRAIMLSAGVPARQLPTTPRARQVDPTNELRWRFERRRLEAEEVRDSILAVSGRLDRSMPGAAPVPAAGRVELHAAQRVLGRLRDPTAAAST